MDISITPPGGQPFYLSGGYPAQGLQQLRLASQSQVQDVLALGAADITQFLRGNKKLTYTYKISFVLPDAETAAYFVPAFEAQFPIAGALEYITDYGTLYMASAIVALVLLENVGASCTLDYRITGGGFYRDTACTEIPEFPVPIG